MNKLSKCIISCIGLVAIILLCYGSGRAGSIVTRVFSSDDDFAHFNLTNIETVGSDAGIRLEDLEGGYKPSGEATYRFSPGVYARWKKATIISSGSGLDVQFSTNNIDYSGIKNDGSFGDTVSASADLYIRIRMKGGATTPILSSLSIEYENDSRVRVILEKRVYKCEPSSGSDACQNANSLGQAEEKPTFEPGDIAGVSIKLNSATQSDISFNLTDYLPNEAVLPIEVTTSADRSKYCHLSSSDAILTGAKTEIGRIYWESLTATSSDQYVCYRFGVGEATGDAKNKNNFEQINAIAYRSDVGYEKIIGSSNSYMMIRGFAFIQSQEDPNRLDVTRPFQLPVIEDELGFALTKILFSNPTQISNSSPSYVYIRGAGQKSRGGTLVSLPVKMKDLTGNNTFFEDQFYLLYNPIFYLFGNMFSGSSPSSTAFDFGHGSSSISTGDFGNEKLNTASSLYNYYFDTQSVLFWDRTNRDKNKTMEENIARIIGEEGNRPDNFCELDNINALRGQTVYLNNKNCAISQADNSNIWPNGRVWYIKATSDIEISSRIAKGGTIVVDFGDTSADYKVMINTQKNDFPNNSFLGLILINGGNIEFTRDATYFRGITFSPGRSGGGGGRVVFAQDGESLLVRGSVIADEIDFNKRRKDNNKKYAVSVYLDGALINARIPGFEKLMDIIVGQ